MNSLIRTFKHLQEGTFSERLYQEIRRTNIWLIRRFRYFRGLWWDTRIKTGKRDFLDFNLTTHLLIRLYRDSELSRMIYVGGFEKTEQTLLVKFLNPGDIFVDVGSNIGLYSLLAGSRVGEYGKVFAFEPQLKTFQRLLENVHLNKMQQIHCYQAGLSNHNGTLPMNVLSEFDAWSSFVVPVQKDVVRTEYVRTVRWEDFAESHNLVGKIKMMKIDVEGWEGNVIIGGKKVLSREDAPILQIEFNEQALQVGGSSCGALAESLLGLGYKLYKFIPKKNTFIQFGEFTADTNTNLYAIKDMRNVSRRSQ